jgi:hypothetical protein
MRMMAHPKRNATSCVFDKFLLPSIQTQEMNREARIQKKKRLA